MKIFKEKISIVPDRSLYPKLGQTGYSVGEAIAELVDNSIDARLEKKLLTIEIVLDKNAKEIIISDDGVGMNKKTATKCLVLGYSQKKDQLGQFGLGLKTACESLGKKFSITTTKSNSEEEYLLEFNEEEWLKKGDWSDFEIRIKKGVNKRKHGTKVIIGDLKIVLYPNLTTNIRKQLEERFAPFILNNEARIKVNTQWLKPEQPELIEGTRQGFEIKLKNGDIIKGWTGILKIGSQEKSGFNLFKRGRLIRAHEKLGYAYHPSKMWIIGDVYMDPISVTHNKREFITESDIYLDFFEKLQEIIGPVLAEAQKRHRDLQIKDLPPEKKETLKDNLLRALNKTDEYQELAFPQQAKPAKRSHEEGELFEKEKREKIGEVREEIKIEKKTGKEKGKRVPKKTQKRRVRFITIAGKKYQFDWDWKDFDEEISKVSEIDRDGKKIMVFLNSRFPLLNIVKDEVLYISMFVTEGIAEVFVRENKKGSDKVISLRDSHLKNLAKIVAEDIELEKKQRLVRKLEIEKEILKKKALEREEEIKE